MESTKSKQVVLAAIIIGVLLIAAASVFALNIPGLGRYQKVKVVNGLVTIPVSKLTDGSVQFYKFGNAGKEITFFAVKAVDGSYKTAFDACDSCYKSRKGYEQQGDKMNCKNCNQKFAINRLGPNATGGCNPGYLPNQQNGTAISIKADDLQAGSRYF